MAKGPAFHWRQETLDIPHYEAEDREAEAARLAQALQRATEALQALAERVSGEVGASEAALFEAQAMFLDDPALLREAHKGIEVGQNAEAAWEAAVEHFADQLESLPDETLRARAADVRDVGRRVLRLLLGVEEQNASPLEEKVVVIASDLTPSETAGLDKSKVLAFCTAEGGPTSHTAILAKALGIPAVVGLGEGLAQVPKGAILLIDGGKGEVVVEPDEKTLKSFEKWLEAEKARKTEALADVEKPAVTVDGQRVEIAANVGSIEEAGVALEYGAEGIGLLRTEFLFLNKEQAPGEEEQTAAYRAVLGAMGRRPVVVRTLDVGGDKEMPYIDLDREANPFLGLRAIRFSLQEPEMFKTQLRALLRAAPGYDLRVMFPMVATLEEVRQAKALFEEARLEVQASGGESVEGIQVGMMVEVPSAALLADRFAAEVDFFSIGSNDLTQYTLAAERTNPRLAHLNDACHPAVLRQIERVVQAARPADIWVGVCGEMAGDPEAIPLLLGLGVDELSMAPALIPQAKLVVRQWSLSAAQALALEALKRDSAAAARAAVRGWEAGSA